MVLRVRGNGVCLREVQQFWGGRASEEASDEGGLRHTRGGIADGNGAPVDIGDARGDDCSGRQRAAPLGGVESEAWDGGSATCCWPEVMRHWTGREGSWYLLEPHQRCARQIEEVGALEEGGGDAHRGLLATLLLI